MFVRLRFFQFFEFADESAENLEERGVEFERLSADGRRSHQQHQQLVEDERQEVDEAFRVGVGQVLHRFAHLLLEAVVLDVARKTTRLSATGKIEEVI